MIKSILIMAHGDPAGSGRVAEAVRLAAGIQVCRKVVVRLYLHGPAVKALDPETGEVVDGEELPRYWPILAAGAEPVFVQSGALKTHGVLNPQIPCYELDESALFQLAARCDLVWRFSPASAPPDEDRQTETGLTKAVALPKPEARHRVLRVLTDTAPPYLDRIAAGIQRAPDTELLALDLTGPDPDYRRLLRAIFRADSIIVA